MNVVRILSIAIIALHCSFTRAASLGVWPINPRIDAPASTTLIWVKNNNKSEAVVLQARIFSWQQIDNNDQTTAQDELVVSPPIIEVKADAQQTFRVINRNGAIQNITQEKSYRLIIDEIPKEGSAQGSALRFQMRYSLPLFVGTPKEYENYVMIDRLKKMSIGMGFRVIKDPSPFIEINNHSSLHARLSNLSVLNNSLPEKKILINTGLLGYVLPNSSKRWPITNEQFSALSQQNITLTFEQEHQELVIAAER